MFDALSDKLSRVFKDLRGQGRLTEENISDGLREVRLALLEADVALPVVRDFIQHVKDRALDKEVLTSLTPGQALIKIVNEELIALMGDHHEPLNLNTQPPAVILLAGLQGAGKTTTAAKLGRYLKEKQKKKVAVVSCDIYRPAAIKQLQTLAKDNDLVWIESNENQKATDIAKNALDVARVQLIDVLIVDSAGRLHIDNEMMQEIQSVHKVLSPVETLFVIDSMTGQDAVNAAAAFNEALPLTGSILTKTDGDARGGAALTVKHVTGKPIKFMGTGEKATELSAFHPERIASRILGMGDVLSLIEEVQEKTDQKEAEKLAKKLKSGKGFNLEDFREQLNQMSNMGGIAGLMDKLPGMNQLPPGAASQVNDKEFIKLGAIIDSMTRKEKIKPDIINGSRKKRIAKGSGTQIQDINRLLKQFKQMQKMMKKMAGKGGMAKMMRGMGGMGGMPPGMPPFRR
ncbi:MAG TPA: signal recognition particle protein [Thiotrichaceae bacterium]|jgi:signal recognition particle subunit SRP54|nr:signal recognition particle protein [Thiotrichaceae bacterium]HIM08464.1 signal recognition particle protein [Gammaproteobacteria bacterium]